MPIEGQLNLKKGEKAAKYSSLINFILAISKGIVGFFSGSIALVADSVHSFSDIFASLAVYVGLRISRRKPDEKFPYGYYKVETFVSLVISVIIILSGIEIIIESINNFLNPEAIGMPFIGLLVAALSALVCLGLSRYKERVGREIKSQALINDGKHSLIDVFSSFIVFSGILAAYIGYYSLQSIAGVLVSILIITIGVKQGKDSIMVLLDVSFDPEKVKKIYNLLETIPGVEGVHDIKIRRSGPVVFAEIHLETKKDIPVKKAYEISGIAKARVRGIINELDSIIIQIEPVKKEMVRLAIPVENNKGIHSTVSDHFGRSPYFFMADILEDHIDRFFIKSNPGRELEKKKGIISAKFLAEENVDVLLTREDLSEGPKYVLLEELIQIKKALGNNLEEILKTAINDENNS